MGGNLGIRPAAVSSIPTARRAMVMILDDDPLESARLSEPALAADWHRPEEDAAWSHLQQDR